MEVTLTLTPHQLTILDKALQALPLGESFEVYVTIKNQVEAQTKPKIEDSVEA